MLEDIIKLHWMLQRSMYGESPLICRDDDGDDDGDDGDDDAGDDIGGDYGDPEGDPESDFDFGGPDVDPTDLGATEYDAGPEGYEDPGGPEGATDFDAGPEGYEDPGGPEGATDFGGPEGYEDPGGYGGPGGYGDPAGYGSPDAPGYEDPAGGYGPGSLGGPGTPSSPAGDPMEAMASARGHTDISGQSRGAGPGWGMGPGIQGPLGVGPDSTRGDKESLETVGIGGPQGFGAFGTFNIGATPGIADLGRGNPGIDSPNTDPDWATVGYSPDISAPGPDVGFGSVPGAPTGVGPSTSSVGPGGSIAGGGIEGVAANDPGRGSTAYDPGPDVYEPPTTDYTFDPFSNYTTTPRGPDEPAYEKAQGRVGDPRAEITEAIVGPQQTTPPNLSWATEPVSAPAQTPTTVSNVPPSEPQSPFDVVYGRTAPDVPPGYTPVPTEKVGAPQSPGVPIEPAPPDWPGMPVMPRGFPEGPVDRDPRSSERDKSETPTDPWAIPSAPPDWPGIPQATPPAQTPINDPYGMTTNPALVNSRGDLMGKGLELDITRDVPMPPSRPGNIPQDVPAPPPQVATPPTPPQQPQQPTQQPQAPPLPPPIDVRSIPYGPPETPAPGQDLIASQSGYQAPARQSAMAQPQPEPEVAPLPPALTSYSTPAGVSRAQNVPQLPPVQPGGAMSPPQFMAEQTLPGGAPIRQRTLTDKQREEITRAILAGQYNNPTTPI